MRMCIRKVREAGATRPPRLIQPRQLFPGRVRAARARVRSANDDARRPTEELLELPVRVGVLPGLDHPTEIGPHQVYRRTTPDRIARLDELYAFLEPGQLLEGDAPAGLADAWRAARADRFSP